MARAYKKSCDRWMIMLSSLITALLILISGLLWMMLFQNGSADNGVLAAHISKEDSVSEMPISKTLTSENASESEISVQDISVSEADDLSSAVSEPVSENIPSENTKIAAGSQAVDASYLDDAVFIGDSISVSLSLYKAVPYANVIAAQNVNLYQVTQGDAVFSTATGKVSLKTALAEKDPKKIYILLGANGMNGWSNEKQIGYYAVLLDQLEEWYPNAVIYVQSMTPVTASRNKTDKNINNTKISDYNDRLLKLVEKRGDHVCYLNISETLMTRYGNLKAKYDGGDGLHFSPAAAEAVVQYVLTHTVQQE